MQSRADDIRSTFAELITKNAVPGASLAIFHEGEEFEFCSGIANLATGIEVTDDTLFLAGSIQKLFTASLVMQLVEEGSVGLDEPITSYLSDYRLGDGGQQSEITLRRLLAHTSGIDGDQFFVETGRGDDAIARYVNKCEELEFLHPPGLLVSYCNAGFVIAGRVIEVITGHNFDAALRERIIEPLGMKSSTTLPEEAILHRVAVGHFPSKGADGHRVTAVWASPRALGPAGGTLATTAADLMRFGQCHLGGATRMNEALTAELVLRMQEPQPPEFPVTARGLGWEIFEWDGVKVLAHDGANGGQCSYLRVVPDRSIVIALMANWARGPQFADPFLDWVFDELFGIRLPNLPNPSADPSLLNPSPYVGRYTRLGVTYEVSVQDDQLIVTIEETGRSRKRDAPIRWVDGSRFLVDLPVFGDVVLDFLDTDKDGLPEYWYAQGRAARKVS